MKNTIIWSGLALIWISLLAFTSPHSIWARMYESNSLQEELPTATPTGTPLPQEPEPPAASAPSPAHVINAVNNLRLSRGLQALAAHAALMQVAADQASALAASGGTVGHERPCGMTLGQDLLARGYPLLGDLSMDGYRSENWGIASTAEEIVNLWLGDELHTNTMLSPDRSDIGAAVAVSDQIYVVLETALSTSSGMMQYDAYSILTGIPLTQAACVGMITQAAQYGLSSQDMLPVTRSTALPGGEVYHEVKYGQTLWTLAIQYDTTIAEIKRLNNLASEVIAPGQKLLVKTGATQPAPDPLTPSPIPADVQPSPLVLASPATPTLIPTVIGQAVEPVSGNHASENSLLIVVLVVGISLLLAGIAAMGQKK